MNQVTHLLSSGGRQKKKKFTSKSTKTAQQSLNRKLSYGKMIQRCLESNTKLKTIPQKSTIKLEKKKRKNLFKRRQSTTLSLFSALESSIMEGTLSKWTNVMSGWQYRYFVLNDDSLRYFTSRDKMIRGQQRGCIRLNNAAIGIEEENTSLFTITVDGKVFHFQGKDKEERDMWVKELERVIHLKSGYYRPRPEDPLVDLKTRAMLSERQLQDLLEIVRKLEQLEHNTDKSTKIHEKKKRYLNEIIQTTKRLQSTVEHSNIILKQVQTKFNVSIEGFTTDKSIEGEDSSQKRRESNNQSIRLAPQVTYSSSEEDEFFDAASGVNSSDESDTTEDDETDCAESADSASATKTNGHNTKHHFNKKRSRRHKHSNHSDSQSMRSKNRHSGSKTPTDEHHKLSTKGLPAEEDEPDWGDAHENFDEIYENTDESELGNVQQQHGSVLSHLLSQVSLGMDLTKVTLPTFILERRSLLEMYADFFAHPEDFINADQLSNPEDRIISVVKYYLNAFYPARKSGVAKKPYNPILGETFKCRWNVPGLPLSGKKTEEGPFPGSDVNQVTFVAEQVSHHPPISAFYAEHPAKRISLAAHIWTKSSFLGLSIGVANIGNAVVTLHNFDEQYVVTFPSGYGRSIMGTPWVELGGKVEVRCEKSGYYAEIEFLTKPFIGGKPHKISGTIYKSGQKKPIMTLRGEWNGEIFAKGASGEEYLFTDVKAKPEVKKECDPTAKQEPRESRRLWRHVTVGLFRNKINVASSAKRWIEQRQRDETKQRQEQGIEHQQKFFKKLDQGGWEFKSDLKNRSDV